MEIMTKGIVVFIAILLAANVAASAMVHREMRAGYGSGPGNVEDIAVARDLDLTAEQREKIDALRDAHLKDIKPLQDELYMKNRRLKDLWLARMPDRESILALQREVQALRNQLMDKLTTYRLDAWQLLTPDQQAKVRPYGPERRPVRMGGSGLKGGYEHGRGLREPFLPPAGVAP